MYQSIEIQAYGIPMTVQCEYDPGESMIWSGPQAGPGYAPAAVIEQVFIGGINVYDMLNDKQLERIEEAVIRAIEE